jgi:hypothetical protein
MSLFGDTPQAGKTEKVGKHGRILKSTDGPKVPEKISDPTLFKSQKEAEAFLKSNDAYGKVYLVDVNHKTGDIRPADIGIQKTNPTPVKTPADEALKAGGELLKSVDQGGVPGFISKNMRHTPISCRPYKRKGFDKTLRYPS